MGSCQGGRRKWSEYEITDPDTGEQFHLAENSGMYDIKIFAGKGTRNPLKQDVKEGLTEKYGGIPENWQHVKGKGVVDYQGEEIKAEIHWFQEKTAGKHRFKIKKWYYDES